MSYFYIKPNVAINTLVLGGKGPYGTAPYDYRLGCNHKKRCKCYNSKKEPHPRKGLMCQQNYEYYGSAEKMLQDKVKRINYETAREERRGLRKPNINKRHICPKDWYLDTCQYCRGPRGYSGLRSRAGN